MDPISQNDQVAMLEKRITVAKQMYRHYADQTSQHFTYRWIAFTGLLGLFATRILLAQSWYIIAYGLGIHLLNGFLAVISPKFLPSVSDSDLESGGALPTKESGDREDPKPFVPKQSEFQFWEKSVWAVLVSIVATLFSVLDVPVFWPVLVMYWMLLFFFTMGKEVRNMIVNKYIPSNAVMKRNIKKAWNSQSKAK